MNEAGTGRRYVALIVVLEIFRRLIRHRSALGSNIVKDEDSKRDGYLKEHPSQSDYVWLGSSSK
jgi:hypothetical protein